MERFREPGIKVNKCFKIAKLFSLQLGMVIYSLNILIIVYLITINRGFCIFKKK